MCRPISEAKRVSIDDLAVMGEGGAGWHRGHDLHAGA